MFYDLPQVPSPEKITVINSEGDTRVPYERIKSYDDKEYELFIREWVTTLKGKYQVRGFGGAGDKGRDVIARDDQGKYYYYQCKHYQSPLTPSVIIPEFGKLVYYTFSREIPVPVEYYILASHDIGPALSDMIDHPSTINQALLDKWDSSCKSKIRTGEVALTAELKQYISNFDFSIVKTKTMLEVVNDHKNTAFYAFRFGGGLTVKRDYSKIIAPKALLSIESVYVKKYLEAVSEKVDETITSVEQLKEHYPRYWKTLSIHRERFFSAENLKVFVEENLLNSGYYKDLADDIYFGVIDLFQRDYNSGMDRLIDVMSNVVKIDLSQNLLVKYDLIRPQDRQGICHQLANERDDVTWVQTQ